MIADKTGPHLHHFGGRQAAPLTRENVFAILEKFGRRSIERDDDIVSGLVAGGLD